MFSNEKRKRKPNFMYLVCISLFLFPKSCVRAATLRKSSCGKRAQENEGGWETKTINKQNKNKNKNKNKTNPKKLPSPCSHEHGLLFVAHKRSSVCWHSTQE
jgi:hypothetical protein